MSTIEVWTARLSPGDVIPYTKEVGFAAEVIDPPRAIPGETGTLWVFPAITHKPNVRGGLDSAFMLLEIPTGLVQVIRPEGSPWA